MRYLLIFMMIFGSATQLSAQDESEYRMEIGAGLGLNGYLGDFNGNLTKDLQPMATAMARYVFNPYTALRMNVSVGTMKGSSDDVGTYYPDYAGAPVTFNNTLYDVCLTYEYNFWPYGTGRDYRGAKRFTPFVFAGVGGAYVDTPNKGKFAMNVPLGLGVKYKMSERMNLGLEWALHFSQTDELDGVKDPYYVTSSGLFKNTDCYSALQFTLTYSFMAKCSTCNKE
ncbi:MAG: DUF6089 family protein [Prevotella sp.]|nr:DUF6089 family protein [Prevotella sp.]MDD3387027.1 DUF6089 family protein [Prevotella sp.]MDD4533774.1 DUF6089 family protein [Prevotella sp.]